MSCSVYFEVLWYENEDAYWKQFKTRKQALDYYHKHENDVGKSGWWITKRNDDEILEDIVW